MDTTTEKLEYLRALVKKNKCKRLRKDIAYRPERFHVKAMLADWLQDELYMLEQRNKSTGKAAAEGSALKILLGVSVSQLSFLIRVCLDRGVFRPESKNEVYRHFAKHFRTLQQEDVSDYSIKKKSEQPDFAGISGGHHVVDDLINYIKRNFM